MVVCKHQRTVHCRELSECRRHTWGAVLGTRIAELVPLYAHSLVARRMC